MIAILEIILPLALGLAIIVLCATDNDDPDIPCRSVKFAWITMAGILALVTLGWILGPSRTIGRWAELQLLWLAPVLFWSAIALRAGNRNRSRNKTPRILRNGIRFLLWFALGIGLSWATSLLFVQYLALSPRAISWPVETSVRVGEWVDLFLPALTTFHGRMDGWAWNRAILSVIAGIWLWRLYRPSTGIHADHQAAGKKRILRQVFPVFMLGLVGISAFAPSSCRSWRFGWCEGRLTVPLNALSGSDATIEISYMIHPASSSDPATGVMFVANGGPSMVSPFRSQMLDALGRIAETHDVLISDYRGLGRSNPADCPGFNIGAAAKEVVEQCARRLGPLANELSARRAADDLEAIRRHLKLGPVDIYGESYGTFFAQTYAHLYPDAVRSMVLDSSIPLDIPPEWMFSLSAQRTSHPLQRYCEQKGKCGSDPLRLVSAWRDTVELTRNERWEAPSVIDLAEIHAYKGWFVEDWAKTLLLEGKERKEALAALSDKLQQQIEAMRGSENSMLMPHEPSAVYACNDYPTPFAWSDQPAARERSTRARARRLFSDDIAPFTWDEFNQGAERIVGIKVDGYMYEGCLNWDHRNETPPVYGNSPPVDVLLISGLLDDSTTPKMTADIAARWPGAKTLYVGGGDHFVLGDPQAGCARDEAAKFFDDPKGYKPSECAVNNVGHTSP